MSVFPLTMRRPMSIAVLTAAGLIASAGPAAAALIWNWSYSGTGIAASGTFTTVDTADGFGYYLITDITGTRNGNTITGLQTTGTGIPGNESYPVDNLVSRNAQQLTGNGFGYSTAGGNYANPFYADFLSPPGYEEFYSMPSPPPGSTSELPINFSATLIAAPAPATYALMASGLGLIGFSARRRQIQQ